MTRGIWILIFFLYCSASHGQRVYNLELKGAEKTNEKFIRNLMQTKSGVPLDTNMMLQDVEWLKRLPSIAHAYFQVFHSHDDYYNVFYYIEENVTLIPAINIWTVQDRLWVRGGLDQFNLFGRNMLLGGFYQYNGKNTYGLNFRAPFLFSSKYGLAFSIQDLTSDEPVYFGTAQAFYEYRNRSVELLGVYQPDFHNRIEFGGSFFNERFLYLEGAEEIMGKPELVEDNKSLIKLNYEYYKAIIYYQYLDGLVNGLYFQTVVNNRTPENVFLIIWNDLKYYKRIDDRGNLAFRMRVGLSSNENSPFSPFVLDNHVNIRGVGDRIDRGTGVFILNSEYRYTVYEKPWGAAQVVGFLDAGTWRQPGGDFDDFVESQNINLHPGGGLRFILKQVYNAVLRIDYGFGITENNAHGWVIGLGQYF